jgi:hypothetical protein
MTSLYSGTALFAASLLLFGVVYYVSRIRPASTSEGQEVVLSVFCVAITGMIALAGASYMAALFDWKTTLSDVGLTALGGFALVDGVALMLAALLVGLGRRHAGPVLQTSLGHMPVEMVPVAANSPTRPVIRSVA